MGTENENNFETVEIEGEVWAVTAPSENVPAEQAANTTDAQPSDEAQELSRNDTQESVSEDTVEQSDDPQQESTDDVSIHAEREQTLEDFDALRSLTRLLVGGAIEGTTQLTARLQRYEEALREEAAEMAAEGIEPEAIPEDELIRLRYALVGMVFSAQETFWKNASLWAKVADRSVRVTNRVAQPVTNSFMFNPIRRRYLKLVKRGEDSLARWIADGRVEEQPSRELARRTYEEVVDEFIDRLAENPQLQAVITKQSISVASDMRDEVRERTVTADNLVEGLVRRVLRRTPRAELPEPSPEIQRWAGLTLEEYRDQKLANEQEEGDA